MCDMIEVCANCGKESSDTVRLKNCTACRLVKYCGVDCQRAHRKQHKGPCKKRAAELKDERLYTQGHERPEDDFCPICTLPIPLPMDNHSGFSLCCMKRVCDGCFWAAEKRGMLGSCPFCRRPRTEDDVSKVASVKKRVDAKDPSAVNFLAGQYFFGSYGLEKDAPRAMELWKEAAELGSIGAHYNLGCRYFNGEGVPQDTAKSVQHWEKAACQGHVEAWHNLGCIEIRNGNYERGIRHRLIAAKMGYTKSLNAIKDMFAAGHASKQQYAEALKGYQDAVKETKSPERDEARIRRLRTIR